MDNTKINPKVSIWSKKYFPSTGNLLKSADLYTTLKYQETIDKGEKGKNGIAFMYTNNTAYPDKYNCDGLFYIDIDNVSEYSEIIYSNFEKIAERFPNLLAICFSASRNIHAFVYDERFKGVDIDLEEYCMWSKIYISAFAWIVKSICEVDLRDVNGALDYHTARIGQPMYLTYSEFKWNTYCMQWDMDKNDVKRLKAEYHRLFKSFIQMYDKDAMDEVVRVKREENAIFNKEVPRIIDKDTWFGKLCGNELRRMIASNIMVYCDGDEKEAKKLIDENFDSPSKKEIASWLRYNYSKFYNRDLYEWLFVRVDDKICLEQDQYLNDVLYLGDEKYVYIISNTNTGKTEWCKSMIRNNNNVIALYPNKVLRDGKRQGVEEYTYVNEAKEVDKTKSVNITIDLFTKLFNVSDMEGKTVIVDEAHLLQDYISIQGRREIIKDTINMIQYADRIVFMSATPKAEMKLFKFKTMKFEKTQLQNLHVRCMLLDVDKVNKSKKISKSNALYNYMNNFIEDKLIANGKKVVIFSDKAQNKWKKYGLYPRLENKTCGLYRSKDNTDDCLKQINDFNNLCYPTTLATRYLGVGVEIKNEDEGHIVMNLDEGFDIAFVEQCIGRYRDAKDVYLYLFTSKNPDRVVCREEEEKNKQLLMSYYVDLYDDTDDLNRMNILKAMKLNAYDGFEEDKELREAVGMLLANNIISRYDYASLISVHLMLKRLPYEKIDMKSKVVKLGKKEMEDSFVVYENDEDELRMYISSMDDNQLMKVMQYTVDEILNKKIVPFVDKIMARKILKMIKPIVKRGWSFSKWNEFFDGKLSTMVCEKEKMMKYCRYMRGDYSDEVGSDDTLEEMKLKLEKEFKDVEMLWNKEFLKDALTVRYEVLVDDIFEMMLDDEEEDMMHYFNFNSYKEYKNAKKFRNKKCKIMTDKLEKKYGLVEGVEYDSFKSIADAGGVNAETIRLWKKKGYLIEI